jgi:DNA polymerase elongation subunit (family B)
MSQCLQFEIDPLKITENIVGSVLVSVDVVAYSAEEYPGEAKDPICMIAAAHTGGLSSISRVYTKLFVAGAPTATEERSVLRDFSAYLDMFEGGTIAVHYGAVESIDDGFDLPYVLMRVRDAHPELYPVVRRALNKFKRHDTCAYAKTHLNLPSSELDYVESYYGLARKPEAVIGDARSAMDQYWKAGDTTALKYGLTNAYNCIRIAQSQLKKTICCTDVPL